MNSEILKIKDWKNRASGPQFRILSIDVNGRIVSVIRLKDDLFCNPITEFKVLGDPNKTMQFRFFNKDLIHAYIKIIDHSKEISFVSLRTFEINDLEFTNDLYFIDKISK